MKAEKRLYLTRDGERVVDEGHEDAAVLFAAAGDEIPEVEAVRYGLLPGSKGYAAAQAAREQNEAYQRAMATPERQAEMAALRTDAERAEFDAKVRDEVAKKGRSAQRAHGRGDAPAEDDADAKAVSGPPENKAQAPKDAAKK